MRVTPKRVHALSKYPTTQIRRTTGGALQKRGDPVTVVLLVLF